MQYLARTSAGLSLSQGDARFRHPTPDCRPMRAQTQMSFLRPDAIHPSPAAAAFFDIDGTLLGPPSLERRFLRYLRWRRELTAAHVAKWLAAFLVQLWRGIRSPAGSPAGAWRAATCDNKAHLRGLRAAALSAWTTSLAFRRLAFFPGALRRLEWHAAQGHRILLISGTLQPLADGISRQLMQRLGRRAGASASSEIRTCAIQLEVVEGRWTGRVLGEAICGLAKARALKQLAADYKLDLARSHAYGDAWGDRWMLECVGHPAAVNPSAALARLARQRSWRVLQWDAEKSPQKHGNAEHAARTRERRQQTEKGELGEEDLGTMSSSENLELGRRDQ